MLLCAFTSLTDISQSKMISVFILRNYNMQDYEYIT